MSGKDDSNKEPEKKKKVEYKVVKHRCCYCDDGYKDYDNSFDPCHCSCHYK